MYKLENRLQHVVLNQKGEVNDYSNAADSSDQSDNEENTPGYEVYDDIIDIDSVESYLNLKDSILSEETKYQNPRVAILIDDMGWNSYNADKLFNIDAELSYAVLPGLSYSKKIANKAANLNLDVLLHLPMEPKGYPDVNPGTNVILNSMTKEEVLERLDILVGQVPNIVGVNNHMGSSLTENGRVMKIIINYLKQKNLFFVDSLTSGNTVGYKIAKESGVKTAKRNVFLDNVEDVEYVKKQLMKLIRVAKKEGTAIGIGHPHKATLTAIAEVVSEFKKAGVEIVPVSELVR